MAFSGGQFDQSAVTGQGKILAVGFEADSDNCSAGGMHGLAGFHILSVNNFATLYIPPSCSFVITAGQRKTSLGSHGNTANQTVMQRCVQKVATAGMENYRAVIVQAHQHAAPSR